jgi:hypothetical protein
MKDSPVFTILLALAFSLAVCAVIGVGVTAGFDRLIDHVREARERVQRQRSTQEG